jgi:hypothetical protein
MVGVEGGLQPVNIFGVGAVLVVASLFEGSYSDSVYWPMVHTARIHFLFIPSIVLFHRGVTDWLADYGVDSTKRNAAGTLQKENPQGHCR